MKQQSSICLYWNLSKVNYNNCLDTVIVLEVNGIGVPYKYKSELFIYEEYLYIAFQYAERKKKAGLCLKRGEPPALFQPSLILNKFCCAQWVVFSVKDA